MSRWPSWWFLHQLGAVLCFAYGSSAQKATLSWYLPLDTPAAAGSQAAGAAPRAPGGDPASGQGAERDARVVLEPEPVGVAADPQPG